MLGRQGVIRLSPDEEVTLASASPKASRTVLPCCFPAGRQCGRDLGWCHRALPGAGRHRGADNFVDDRDNAGIAQRRSVQNDGRGRSVRYSWHERRIFIMDMILLADREGINLSPNSATRPSRISQKQNKVAGAVGHDQAAPDAGVAPDAGNGKAWTKPKIGEESA